MAQWHPVDLSAVLLDALVRRAGVSPAKVGRVVWAANSQVGAQAANIGRRAVLAAGWPDTVPAGTVDAQAVSSLEAVLAAAESVASGATDVVVAGGVEVASAVPLGAAYSQPSVGRPLGRKLTERYTPSGGMPPPGLVAEEIARARSLTRRRLDDWALTSQRRAMEHRGVVARNLVDVDVTVPVRPPVRRPATGSGVRLSRSGSVRAPADGALGDEALGSPLTATAVRTLPPAYLDGGVVTAANFALEGDGAAGVVVAGADFARRQGLAPLAEIVAWQRSGFSPLLWPMAAVTAARGLLAGLGPDFAQVGRWRVLETSAAAVLAWADEMEADPDRINAEGGELATTCPLGAAGAGMLAGALAATEGLDGNGAVGFAAAGEGGVGASLLLRRL